MEFGMNKWLFLRGEWDERTEQSIVDDDDMWIQYADELNADIYFNRGKYQPTGYIRYNKSRLLRGARLDLDKYTHVFSRGGFRWQADILRKMPKVFKIRYAAGRRYMPEKDIKYDIVLCDSKRQYKHIRCMFPNSVIKYFLKPAANHFRKLDIEKKYHICFVAKDEQASFKGTQWVYNTAPKDLKILHLGSDGRYDPPKNITCKKLNRIYMPMWMSMCKIGILPYWQGIDSCPRVLPEMLSCGLGVVTSDVLDYCSAFYRKNVYNRDMDHFWSLDVVLELDHSPKDYSLKRAVKYLLDLVLEERIKNV